jgi:D-alanine-D-alanine ligase
VRKKLKKILEIDMAIVCLHGVRGEDGSVSGVLELSKIPYSISSMCASSVCIDKGIFKILARGMGVNVVPGFAVTENEYLQDCDVVLERIKDLNYPVILKPSRQGSSIGIEVCKSESLLDEKLKNAFKYDKNVLIEKFLNVEKEVNIAILDDKGEYVFSATEEPVTVDEILSFDNKYRKNSGGFETIKRILPANIDKEKEDEVRRVAAMVYKALDMFGIVRFDFIIDDHDCLYLNEVNTIPGSMANYLFDKAKYDYAKLIDVIVSNSIHRHLKQNDVERVLNTDILDGNFDGFKK